MMAFMHPVSPLNVTVVVVSRRLLLTFKKKGEMSDLESTLGTKTHRLDFKSKLVALFPSTRSMILLRTITTAKNRSFNLSAEETFL
jgi:hypothetical protein